MVSEKAMQLDKTDLLAAARLRATQRQQALLEASDGTLSAEQAAEILGLSQKAVDKRRRQGRVIGLSQGHRGYVYPAWQFENGNMLPHLEKVLDVLRRHDPWMQMEFFLNGNDRLSGESPLDALRKGHVASVLRAASGFGEHGTA